MSESVLDALLDASSFRFGEDDPLISATDPGGPDPELNSLAEELEEIDDMLREWEGQPLRRDCRAMIAAYAD